jgi:hypothetical protein
MFMNHDDVAVTVARLVPLLVPVAREIRCESGDPRALLKSRFDSTGIAHRDLLIKLGIAEGHGIDPFTFNMAVDDAMLQL